MDPFLHLDRALDGLSGVVGYFERRVPDDHDVVTVVLVHRAIEAVDDVDHPIEVAVQVTEERRGRHAFGHRREAANVAEQHGDLAVLAAEPELTFLLHRHDRARD